MARSNQHEQTLIKAIKNGATHVWRTTSRHGNRPEQFIIMKGSEEIGRVPTSKIADATRTMLLKVTNTVYSDDYAIQRKFEVVAK